jgi:hypothetical protein
MCNHQFGRVSLEKLQNADAVKGVSLLLGKEQ